MGALYHLKQKLVDFCNVIQENVSRTDTVPSSKVVYDLKADTDSQISTLNDSLANLDTYVMANSADFAALGTGFSGTVKVYRAQRVLSVSIQVTTTQAISDGDITLATGSFLYAPSAGNTFATLHDFTDKTEKRLSCLSGALKLQYVGAIPSGHQLQGTATYLVNL